MSWKFAGSCFGDSFIIDGVDIFKDEWEDTGVLIGVVDPLYGQTYKFRKWKVKNENREITFVAPSNWLLK